VVINKNPFEFMESKQDEFDLFSGSEEVRGEGGREGIKDEQLHLAH
jgi:hypothetical protein